jgi:Tol biopolymer transport system component
VDVNSSSKIFSLTNATSEQWPPAWSPDGNLIAYVSRIDGKFQVCTVDPFGVTTRVLTRGGNNEDPKWSADGMHLVFFLDRRWKFRYLHDI